MSKELPNDIKELLSSTSKLLLLTTAAALLGGIAYGLGKGLAIWGLFALVVIAGQLWAFRVEIKTYLIDRNRPP